MHLAQVLRLLAACALALAALGVNARPMDDVQAQNTPLEKIQPLPLDCPRVWLAQAVDSSEENAITYDDSVSGPTHYNYFRSYQPTQGRYTQGDPIGLAGGLNRFGYVGGNPLSYTDPTGEFGIPGAIAGGIIGAASGGFGAAATGGNITTGAILGGIGGAFVGGLGPVIGPTIAGQVLSRVASGALGNVLGQGQGIGDPGFQGFNVGSMLGSGVGGALGGLIAPASYGTAFFGPLAGQIVQRGIAGLPGAAVSGTSSLIGNRLGAGQTCPR